MQLTFAIALGLMLAAETPAPKWNPGSYIIGPEDVLFIQVWKEPDLSRRVPVRPDGRISLPLLNDMQAAGLTPNELASQVSQELKKYLTEVDVAVVVEQVNSRRIYVMGEVVRPGAYPLLAPTSVLQALSAACGFREFANTKKIHILRGVGIDQKKLLFDYNAVVKGKKPAQNILLENGDTIVVP